MQTITLSETAIALLRFRAMRCPMKIREQDREAFRELVNAGIMKPDGASYRFTDDGRMRREDILREREEKIERELFEPPDASNLSKGAGFVVPRRIR